MVASYLQKYKTSCNKGEASFKKIGYKTVVSWAEEELALTTDRLSPTLCYPEVWQLCNVMVFFLNLILMNMCQLECQLLCRSQITCQIPLLAYIHDTFINRSKVGNIQMYVHYKCYTTHIRQLMKSFQVSLKN